MILARPHLDQRNQNRLNNQDTFKAGLAWATRDINPNVALLQPAPNDSYIIYDYALDLISEQNMQIPESTWTAIIASADTSELLTIGYTAETAHERTETAIQALNKAARSGHRDQASLAALGLGALLRKQSVTDSEKAAWLQIIDSGNPELTPWAAGGLGELLRDQGDVDGAKAAWQQAIDSGHPNWAPVAASHLGYLLYEHEDTDGAKAAYQQVVDSGHPDEAPLALVNLGILLADQGNQVDAKAALQRAVDSGHSDARARAKRILDEMN
ncbi:MAG TPA: tetratricopeptide repeat protein [Streptosporangiaceae bacterium]